MKKTFFLATIFFISTSFSVLAKDSLSVFSKTANDSVCVAVTFNVDLSDLKYDGYSAEEMRSIRNFISSKVNKVCIYKMFSQDNKNNRDIVRIDEEATIKVPRGKKCQIAFMGYYQGADFSEWQVVIKRNFFEFNSDSSMVVALKIAQSYSSIFDVSAYLVLTKEESAGNFFTFNDSVVRFTEDKQALVVKIDNGKIGKRYFNLPRDTFSIVSFPPNHTKPACYDVVFNILDMADGRGVINKDGNLEFHCVAKDARKKF
jgi:hypothetical protein